MFVTSVVVLAVAVSAAGQTTQPAAKSAATQPAARPVAEGVNTFAQFAPADALLFIERAGHDAVRGAFDASNLGEMVHDPVMEKFIMQFLRPRVVEVLAEAVLDDRGGPSRPNEKERDRLRALMQPLLTPLWTNPSAIFLLPPPGQSTEFPKNFGLICVIGPTERKEPQAALDTLMTDVIGGPSATRQPFKWSTGKLTWSGVAFSSKKFGKLPSEATKLKTALADKDMLLVCWTDDYLLAATSLEAAQAWEWGLGRAADYHLLAAEPDFQTVMAKSDTANWALRWFVNTAAIVRMMPDAATPTDTERTLTALGLWDVRAVGGVLGYENKTVVYRTYVLSPKTRRGLLRLFAEGGSYKPALEMMPRTATAALAGQVDPQAVAALIRSVVSERERGRLDDKATLSGTAALALKRIDAIAAGSNGHAGVFMGTINLMDLMNDSSLPLGLVLGMTDEQAATDALASLRALVARPRGGEPNDSDREAAAKTYREVAVHPLGTDVHAAVMADRLIVGLSPQAVRMAIDAAKDGDDKDTKSKGAFAEGSKGQAYLAQAGAGVSRGEGVSPSRPAGVPPASGGEVDSTFSADQAKGTHNAGETPAPHGAGVSRGAGVSPSRPAGVPPASSGEVDSTFSADQAKGTHNAGETPAPHGAGVFFVDFASMARSYWPMLLQSVGREQADTWSLPDTDTLLKHLGPEVAVFESDADGLRITSTGLLPFSTLYGVTYYGMMLLYMGF